MNLIEQHYGPVTVLEFVGKMTLGEGDELMKDKVNSLLAAGRRQIVLDFDRTPYIDSSGLGELVRSYTSVSRKGGHLVLARLSKRIADLLAITKLLTVYETYDTVGAAVQSFGSVQLEASCPLCRPLAWTNYPDNRPLLSCPECDASFYPQLTDAIRSELKSATSGAPRAAPVSHVWWMTYYENSYGREAVQLTLGRPCTIAVTGRLDLWSWDIVERAWDAVPRPKRVLFDVTGVRMFSEKGRTKLMETLACDDGRSRAAVLVHSARTASEPPSGCVPTGPAVFDRRDTAFAALGDLALEAAPGLTSTIRVKN
jgi:anti-sigma B factor antagonist